MLSVKNIQVRSFDLNYLDLFWEVDPTFEDILNFEFVVEKSTSQMGPFYDLTKPFRNKFHLRDTTIKTNGSFYSNTYYRIRVKDLTTSETCIYPENGIGVKLGAKPDLVALEMARMTRLKLKEFVGRKVWLFGKRSGGQRCNCYDPVTKRKLRSKCITCFDTGYVGGFDAPIEAYVQIVSNSEATNHASMTETEVENGTAILSNYPEVSEGWVIVEGENSRWRVGSVIRKIKKNRALVKQVLQVHRIPMGDIEYSLPIKVTDLQDLILAPERNLTNPQSLDSSGILDSALGAYGGD